MWVWRDNRRQRLVHRPSRGGGCLRPRLPHRRVQRRGEFWRHQSYRRRRHGFLPRTTRQRNDGSSAPRPQFKQRTCHRGSNRCARRLAANRNHQCAARRLERADECDSPRQSVALERCEFIEPDATILSSAAHSVSGCPTSPRFQGRRIKNLRQRFVCTL